MYEQRAIPSVLSLIGNTPLVEITRLDTGPCQLFLKLESQNPGGSIKDRVALSMIEDAERTGKLVAGSTIVEATAGNTGLGLALVAAAKKYRLVLVIPDKMSREKMMHLRAMGAEVHVTRTDVNKGHPDYYQDLAARLAREIPNALYIDQFNNPANPLAHETSTAPELWEQCGHRLDAIVCGVGSGGTLTGLGRFFRRAQPDLEMVLADPEGSVLAGYVRDKTIGKAGSWAVEGIGEDFIPGNADMSFVKEPITVSDSDSFHAARELLRQEGILGGSSTGTLLAAALRYCRRQTQPRRVLTFVCDSGSKYLSKMYDDNWMLDQGFIHRPHERGLRDLVTRRYHDGSVVTVSSDDTLLTAFNRMRTGDVSQLPVIDNEHVTGIVDESDLLSAIYQKTAHFSDPVRNAMTREVETIGADENMQKLLEMFDRGHVAVVMDRDDFIGLITRTDLLNFLRRSLS